MNETQKNKLKKILASLSDTEELDSIKNLEEAEMSMGMDELAGKIDILATSSSAEMQQIAASLTESLQRTKSSVSRLAEALVEAHQESSGKLVEAISNMGNTITTSYEKNKPVNAAGVYKDMINQLSTIDKSIKDKPVPVWNWPQYASVGVRNRNFANVDPAVDSLQIGEFDYVSMTLSAGDTTETYVFKNNGASGQTCATVVVVYTSSARTVLSSVTKTPVVNSN